MARIRREDVENVREKARIEDVVGEYVTLKNAGVGSRKGLCPFHDERTPSFHVRPQVGRWHCFGCDEGGDVIDFLIKIDHLTFAESVERLAARLGIQLRYEDEGDGRNRGREQIGNRQRLLEAHRHAQQYYAEQLATADAETARQFLTGRGFDRAAAEHFGVGFAPRSGEALLRHLRGRNFTDDELVTAGLVGRSQRGSLYDRFRGRLLWPIRDITGETIGFGARRLFDDDRIEAKYLNTPETPIYKKTHVLYGVDLARKEIAKSRRIVVVEGYTDVMACHLAGVGTAVATCGTAFAEDHIRIARRLMGDDGTAGGAVVFTFDGDAAGQKAAMRAFEDDQRFVASTFIAVAKQGMDPCDLRVQHGDEAVRELVDGCTPLFEFALRTTLKRYDLNHAEGRVQALAEAAPIVAKIRDGSLRPEYVRQLAGWLGMEQETVGRSVAGAGRATSSNGAPNARRGERPAERPSRPRRAPDLDPVTRMERGVLQAMLQAPNLVPAEADLLTRAAFTNPTHAVVFDAIQAAGGMTRAREAVGPVWIDAVSENAPDVITGTISDLAVSPIPTEDSEEAVKKYVNGIVLGFADLELVRTAGELRSRVQRMDPSDEGYQQAFADLIANEGARRQLKERLG